MKITVLNGSPKGEHSVTLYYTKYLFKKIPGHDVQQVNIGAEINKLVKDIEYFNDVMKKIRESDAIIWSFPVYVFAVPSQVKQFIELISERNALESVAGKYTTAVTTSVHFFDHTCHNYLHSVCEDMGMKYFEGYSASMRDLLEAPERENLLAWGTSFLEIAEKKLPVEKRFAPLSYSIPEYAPGEVAEVAKTSSKKAVILTDAQDKDVNLKRMTDVFVKTCPAPVDVVNIHDIDMKGGCTGCVRCFQTGVCVYKDGFMQTNRERVFSADIMVYAIKTVDRFISARNKMYWDRQCVYGHSPTGMGKHTGSLVSGPLRQLPNLREILDSFAQVGFRSSLAPVVTDEYEDSSYITALIGEMARSLVKASEKNVSKPQMFPGVGAHKLFRDMVYQFRFIFHTDDQFYSKNNLYDFPQKDLSMRIMNMLFPIMMAIPPIRKGFEKNMGKGMLEGFEKVLNS